MPLDSAFSFLIDLKQNNNREWFNDHKPAFLEAQQEVKEFVKDLEEVMETHDVLLSSSTKIFRIYKDVRFSKDKTPYKTSWNVSFKREGAERRGGYYLHLEPNNSFIAGGFFGPNPQDLLHIRKQIQQDSSGLRQAIKQVSGSLGSLSGDQVKSAPKGFSKKDPAIDLLRFKQFVYRKSFTDAEVNSKSGPEIISSGFGKYRPFFDAMSEMLTTDLNGVPLI